MKLYLPLRHKSAPSLEPDHIRIRMRHRSNTFNITCQFTDKETKVQDDLERCPRLYIQLVMELESEPCSLVSLAVVDFVR